MADSLHSNDPFGFDFEHGVEAVIRSAGHYVRASDDLRPRVLEAARLQRSEQSAKRCIWRAGLCIFLLALVTAADQRGLDSSRSPGDGVLVADGLSELMLPAVSTTPRSGDGDWRLIDAFTELRRQQARVLRFAM